MQLNKHTHTDTHTVFCTYRESLAYTRGTVEKKQVAQLRVLLQGDDEEDDNDDRVSDHDQKEANGAVRVGEATEADPGMMVFEAEEEAQPAYEPPPKKQVRPSKLLTSMYTAQ